MRDLVPDKLRSIFSKPPCVQGKTSLILENLESSQYEKVGRIGMIEIHLKPLNEETCWNIASLLKLGIVTPHSIYNLGADFDGCLDIGWRLSLWFRLVVIWRLSPVVKREQEHGEHARVVVAFYAQLRSVSFRFGSHVFLLARKSSAPMVIRAMDLAVAIHTTAIDGPYVQRLSSGSRMTRQHMDMALLA